MVDPIATLTTAIDSANKVANTPLFTTVIDKITGFKISQWAAEAEVRKKFIHDEYEKAKENGISGVQYITNLRQTANLIDTAVKSSNYIDQDKQNDITIHNDFFWNTIEHAKTISSTEIQELLAKIIAGEYNCPGSYSMRTLQTLKMLGKHEIELFEKMCSLCINENLIPKAVIFLPTPNKFFKSTLIDHYDALQELQSLGLFLPNEMITSLENTEKRIFELKYFHKQIRYRPTNETSCLIHLSKSFKLSQSGTQIIQHLQPKYIESYYQWLAANYKILDYETVS